jgi:hypothetical protein
LFSITFSMDTLNMEDSVMGSSVLSRPIGFILIAIEKYVNP